MTAILSPNAAEQLIALLERHAFDGASARHAEELSFASDNVLMVLARERLVSSRPGLGRRIYWHLTADGQRVARVLLQERLDG